MDLNRDRDGNGDRSRRSPRSPSQDLTTVSDEDLTDILLHINREKYPERYGAVRDELVRRYGSTIEGVPVDEYFDDHRRRRPFTERAIAKRRWLKAVLIWGGFVLVVRGIVYLFFELRSS